MPIRKLIYLSKNPIDLGLEELKDYINQKDSGLPLRELFLQNAQFKRSHAIFDAILPDIADIREPLLWPKMKL